MDEVEGARICDLACGQGRVARQRADLGARVVGIDLSANRTLSTYSNTLADAGLQLVRVSEPHAPSAFADSPSVSGMGRPVWAEVPAVLVVGCRKGTSKQGEYYAVAERKTRACRSARESPPKELQQYLARVCQERGWTKDSSSEKFVLFIEEVGERGLCHAQGGWAV